MFSTPQIRKIEISVFLVSAVLIGYQILLVKLFSIYYWHHFAHMIISLALLGFGASGTFLFLLRERMTRRPAGLFFHLPLLLTTALWLDAALWRLIGFNPLLLVWQASEALSLLALSLTLFVPFFLGALPIGLSFTIFPGSAFRLYSWNLAGSALGSLLILVAIAGAGPHEMLLVLSCLSLAAGAVAADSLKKKGLVAAALALVVLLYGGVLRTASLPMSAYKDLVQARNLGGAAREAEVFGPLGLVSVVAGPAYHYLPDLSLGCAHPLPEQKGLFWDGNAVGAINRFSGERREAAFMACRTASLVYELLREPRVFVLGAGSGTEILNAIYHGAGSITAAEMNPDIVRLLRGSYFDYSGRIYAPEKIRLYEEEGRGFLQATADRFDLIQVTLLESMGLASAGVYSLNENYLFTTEALKLCLDRLTAGGILSISRWVENPPRGSLKILATAIDALRASGNNDPGNSIVMIRSWQTATLLVKKGVFQPLEIERVRAFCRSRSFDLEIGPGVRAGETNRFNRMDRSYYSEAAREMLAGEPSRFFREYPFDVRPATDDRPFFSHFFRPGNLKFYFGEQGRLAIPFLDWGYILLWAAFCLLSVLSLLFILVPLTFKGARPGRQGLFAFIYFGCLGLAYMSLEMSFIQQFLRYLFDPVFSASVVIGSFLVYSAAGSLLAGKMREVKPRHIGFAVILIALSAAFILISDPWLGVFIPSLSFPLRVALCSLLIAPLAAPMGFPFPYGLQAIGKKREALVPWAWGINGFFSVLGATAAVLFAIDFGFKATVIAALFLYALCAAVSARLTGGGDP